MNIDVAYKVLVAAKSGNKVSSAVYDDWAVKSEMPVLSSGKYDAVNSYDDFYSICYYYIFGD
jgi:hypothetical protein